MSSLSLSLFSETTHRVTHKGLDSFNDLNTFGYLDVKVKFYLFFLKIYDGKLTFCQKMTQITSFKGNMEVKKS